MFKRWLEPPLRKSVLLVGPRRAGKSTLLKSYFKNHRYITLDDLDLLSWARRDPKDFVEKLGPRFIIDEAQRAPELAIACKWAIDEKKAHLVLTGSTGLELFQSTTETLAGRVEVLELPPSCFGENAGPRQSFRDMTPPEQMTASRKLNDFMRFGGFPEIVSQVTSGEKDALLRNYKNTYFTKDLADLSSLENLEGLRAMYQALIRGLGSRYEVSSLSRESGLSVPTTKKYLNSILQSGLGFKLYGYHHGPVKRHISAAKTYFCDNGVLTSLSDDVSHGQLVESFVISEIEKRRKLGIIRADQLFYYESVGGRDIDLIVEEPEQVTAIEIKASHSIGGRDLRTLREFVLKPNSNKRLKKIMYYGGTSIAQEGEIEIRPFWTLWR